MNLSVQNLTVQYRTGEETITPIDQLSFSVDSGQIVVLLGPSGCGKTTLLCTLAGFLTPTSGTVRFGDVSVTEMHAADRAEFRRSTIGFVFQAFNLLESLTAQENVLVPLRAAGLRKPEAVRTAHDKLTQVGLADRVGHRPDQLSGGQQQRVAIARALAMDPQVVLADEPTAHLDFVQVEETLKLIRSIVQDGRLVIVSTHDHRVLPLADLVVDLTPGNVRVYQPTENQLSEER